MSGTHAREVERCAGSWPGVAGGDRALAGAAGRDVAPREACPSQQDARYGRYAKRCGRTRRPGRSEPHAVGSRPAKKQRARQGGTPSCPVPLELRHPLVDFVEAALRYVALVLLEL